MLTERQIDIFKDTFQRLLGNPWERGAMAYVRCLPSEAIISLCESEDFYIDEWQVYGVTKNPGEQPRLISSDRAVEIREDKADAVLLLIDTARAGAGLDGIFSATREIKETELFDKAIEVAQKRLPRGFKGFCKKAVSKARRLGTISPWREFEFYTHCIDNQSIGEALTILSLWPIYIDRSPNDEDLDKSQFLVQRLLKDNRSSLTVEEKINSLLLKDATEQQKTALAQYLRASISKPFNEALDELRDKLELWLNKLKPGIFDQQEIHAIEVLPWRGRNNRPLTWSGLQINNQNILQLNLNPKSRLEVRWKSNPQRLERDAAQYSVTVKAGVIGEILSEKVLSHNGRDVQKCIFIRDDFQFEDPAVFEAKVHITVLGKPDIEAITEDFLIQFGEVENTKPESSAKALRALIEGAIQIDNKEDFIDAITDPDKFTKDSKGFIVFRHEGKNAKVLVPPLISRIENEWQGDVGRWTIKVRTDGTLAGPLRFIPCKINNERLTKASLALSRLFVDYKGMLGCIGISKEALDEYVNAWIAAADDKPELAHINTLEVKSVSDRTIGLIVLPYHPLMIAWHSAYDHLLAYFRYYHEPNLKVKNILNICRILDGAYYPAFLPGINENESFVFGDTLGFYAVAMVSDRDKEPKAAIALLARTLSEGKEDIIPTVGKSTSDALAEEIHRYIMLHPDYKTFHIHALRPGDGMTIGKALGSVLEKLKNTADSEDEESPDLSDINFVLNLYPAIERSDITGRFFQAVSQRRRTGAGTQAEDAWIFENLLREGNISVPRLHWAKRGISHPDTSAHIATAFDTFESKVEAVHASKLTTNAPIETFGLHPCLLRDFTFSPTPLWRTYVPQNQEGEKHPTSRALTERLLKIQSRLMRITALNIGGSKDSVPVLMTEIPTEKEESIRTLHSLSDWIITIDKNAGIEYFDSPREKPTVFEAYIIDCVPEKEDLGFLQMVTSTANLDEISNLLDSSLTEMGLSASPPNCLFLLNELKSLSGRLAMRLVGQGYQPQEMIALAMTHANCIGTKADDKAWLPLENGFFVPLDEVPYLLNSNDDNNNRADLLYVTALSRGGLQFAFVEVKYRGTLKTARTLDVIDYITKQIKTTRKNWENLYSEEASPLERSIRYCRLARALRFYANKGRRHHLSLEAYNMIMKEIDKMVSEGSRYSFPDLDLRDRGYIFCPEYKGESPALLSFDESPLIYLFGDSHIPDRAARLRMIDLKSDQNLEHSEPQNLTTDISSDDTDSSQQYPPQTDSKEEILAKEIQIREETLIHLGDEIQSAEPIKWKISIKANPHLLLVGLPGMGKTTSLINICTQMLKEKIIPIVFSYHNDIDEKLSDIFCKNIQFVDYNGLGFNPLEVFSGSAIGFIDNISMIRDIFGAIFTDLGDIQLGAIREALKQSYLDNGWEINKPNTENLQTPRFDAFYNILKENPKQDKAVKGLLLRLDELNDYGFFNTSSNVSSLFSSEKPLIIRIHKTQNDVLQKAFSIFVLHNLYKQMFIRGTQKDITHAIIFDEAHRAAKLKLIPTMAKECRKFGVSFVIASQEIRDFDPSIYNTIANYLVLRLNENDARTIAKTIAPSDQVNLYADRIKQMQKYHALFFGEGVQKSKKIRLVDLDKI